VAEKAALGDGRGVFRTFHVACGIMLALGVTSACVLYFGAPWFSSRILGDTGASAPLKAIALAVPLLALTSVWRGFFHGLQLMTPSALSQVAEQFLRVTFSLALAVMLIPLGTEKAVVGVCLGSVVGAFTGFAVFVWCHFRYKPVLAVNTGGGGRRQQEPVLAIMIRLFSLALPVVMGALLSPVLQMLDAVVVPGRLRLSGMSLAEVREWYGYLGMAQNLMNIPNVVTIALSASLVPAVAEALALNDLRLIRVRGQESIRIAITLGLPAAVGLYVLADELCYMLFDYPQAGIPLVILSWGTLALGICQTTSGMLQGLGMVLVPVRNLFIGAIAKLFCNYFLTPLPTFGIRGAAWGTLAGFAIAGCLNTGALRRHTGMKVQVFDSIVRPLSAATLMGVVSRLFYDAAGGWVHVMIAGLFADRPRVDIRFWSNTFTVIPTIILAAGVYGFALLIAGGIRRRDLEIVLGRVSPAFLSRLESSPLALFIR